MQMHRSVGGCRTTVRRNRLESYSYDSVATISLQRLHVLCPALIKISALYSKLCMQECLVHIMVHEIVHYMLCPCYSVFVSCLTKIECLFSLFSRQGVVGVRVCVEWAGLEVW